LVKSSEQLPSIPLLVIGSFLGGLLSGIIGVGIDFIVFSLMAPLGALACKYLPKTVLFYFLLVLVLFDVASTIFILGFKWEFFVFVIVSFLAFILIKVQQEKNQTSTNC